MCDRLREIPFRNIFVAILQFHLLIFGDTCWFFAEFANMELVEVSLYAVVLLIMTFVYLPKQITNHLLFLFVKMIHALLTTIITIRKDVHETIRRIVYYPMIIYIWMTTFILMRICQKMWNTERKPLLPWHQSYNYESIQQTDEEHFDDCDSGYQRIGDDDENTPTTTDYSSLYSPTRSDSSLEDDEIPEVVGMNREEEIIDAEVGPPTPPEVDVVNEDTEEMVFTEEIIEMRKQIDARRGGGAVKIQRRSKIFYKIRKSKGVIRKYVPVLEVIREESDGSIGEGPVKKRKKTVTFRKYGYKRTISRQGIITDTRLRIKK